MKLFSMIQNPRMRTLLTILVVCALIFANFTVLANAADNSTSTNVISTISSVDNIAVLLTAIGVVSPDTAGDDDYDKPLTRGEFARMIVTASPYKGLEAAADASSPFRDVDTRNWAAPYILTATATGLMSGYSDGSFRPNNPVTLEQGVNSTLMLLGYTAEDFSGGTPYAQMNLYQTSSLSNNISGGIGSVMKKKDAANLIFNMMGTKVKDGTAFYAETLGYSLPAPSEMMNV